MILSGQKNMGDKLREMKLAVALEKKFSKEQILEGYLNIVFFNRDAYGIEAASRYFFSTTAKDLTLPQAALLAGLVNSPTFYNPAINPENSMARRNQVLDEMLELDKITQVQHDEAVATPIELKISPERQGCANAAMAPYFCDYISHLILNNPAFGSSLIEARAQALPGRPDHHHHPGQQAAGRGPGPGGRYGGCQPGQVGSGPDHGAAGHRQDPGHGAEHGLPADPGNSIPS